MSLLFGWTGGVPYFHPDAVLDEAIYAIQNHGNPNYFHYPGLVIYAHAALYGALTLAIKILRPGHSLGELIGQIGDHPGPGHLLTVVFAFIGAAAAYWIVLRLLGRRAFALLAAVFVSTSLLWTVNAHYLTVDIPMATLCALAVVASLEMARRGVAWNWKWAVGVGVIAGLAASAKYNGALVLISAIAPIVFECWREPLRMLRQLVITGLAAILTFAVTNPFIFFCWETFRDQFASRAEELNTGRLGFFMSNGWWFHLVHSLNYGYGFVPLLAALLGLVWLVTTRHVETARKWVVVLFPLFYYLVMGRSRAAFPRHILPLIPFLGVFSALGIYWICSTVRRLVPARAGWMVIAVALFAMPLPQALLSAKHNQLLGRGDTREDLAAVLRKTNAQFVYVSMYSGRYVRPCIRRSGIVSGHYVGSSYQFRDAHDPVYRIFAAKTDLIIFDSFSHDRMIWAADPVRLKLKPYLWEETRVIQISPFTVPKESVPHSPDSIYSPFLPDLTMRVKSGPYIEIYCREGALADRLTEACSAAGVPFKTSRMDKGFYWKHLVGE